MNLYKDVLLILPRNGWLNNGLINEGYNLSFPYYGNSVIHRLIRDIHFKIKMGQSIWYNKANISNYKYIFLSATLVTTDYIKWLKKKNPNSIIILVYNNIVNKKTCNPLSITNDYCIKWTCDIYDAKKYNMNFYNSGAYLRHWIVKKTIPVYDVFYIGKDKNRLEQLRQIEKEMNAYGVKTMFYITWERGWQKINDGIHKPFLPYEEVLSYIGKSRAILHLIDGAQNGITIRIQESLIHKVKLITDDKNIRSYDFYNPHNIFILGVDNMNDLRNFLDTPYEDVHSEFFKNAFYDQMIEYVVTSSKVKNRTIFGDV